MDYHKSGVIGIFREKYTLRVLLALSCSSVRKTEAKPQGHHSHGHRTSDHYSYLNNDLEIFHKNHNNPHNLEGIKLS